MTTTIWNFRRCHSPTRMLQVRFPPSFGPLPASSCSAQLSCAPASPLTGSPRPAGQQFVQSGNTIQFEHEFATTWTRLRIRDRARDTQSQSRMVKQLRLRDPWRQKLELAQNVRPTGCCCCDTRLCCANRSHSCSSACSCFVTACSVPKPSPTRCTRAQLLTTEDNTSS